MICCICGAAAPEGDPAARLVCLCCATGTIVMEGPEAESGSRLAQTHQMLKVAVPLWIGQLQALDDPAYAAQWRAWVTVPDESPLFSPVLVVGGASFPRGYAAQAFNELARALAALAFVPGGVPFGHLRFIAYRTPADWQAAQQEVVHAER